MNRTIRLSPWLVAGGALLACSAGYVNVIMLDAFHVPVSHMTGAVSRLGIDLGERNFIDLRMICGIVLAFLAGAILAGLLIGGTSLKPGRRYGVSLMLVGLMLAMSTVLADHTVAASVLLAAMACGLQNGMATHYLGLIIRTTHMTGIVTDLGILIGHWLRHRRGEGWRLIFLLSLLSGFLIGAFLGAVAVSQVGRIALAAAAAANGLAGLGYFAWRHWRCTRVMPA